VRYLFIFILLTIVSQGFGQTYIPVDEESTIEFRIKNFGSSVDGTLTGLKGTIVFDAQNIAAAKLDVTVDANTIDTDIGMRDNHLRKKEYFFVSEYPMIRFVSTSVVLNGPGKGTVTGNLTIRKTTREITIPFTYGIAKNNLTLKGEFPLNRRHFEVGGNSISLSDELKVLLKVTARSNPTEN